MDSSQPASSTTPLLTPGTAGMFGTKTPSAIAFALGLIIFLLPFAELRCSGTKVATKSGLDFSLGNDWKMATGGMFDSNDMKDKSGSFGKEQKGNTQYFAIGAGALAIIGLLLCFGKSKTGWSGGIMAGILSAGSLIGLMLDEKKNYAVLLKRQAAEKARDGTDNFSFNFNASGDAKVTLSFSPWFYLAVLVFLAAAFFCYKRIQSAKT